MGLLWCPSSKAALSNSLSDTLGTEHLCHFRRQCHIRLLIIEPCTSTVAGSYSRCIMVIIFSQSVMGTRSGGTANTHGGIAPPQLPAYYSTLAASNLAGAQQNRTVVRPSAPYKSRVIVPARRFQPRQLRNRKDCGKQHNERRRLQVACRARKMRKTLHTGRA